MMTDKQQIEDIAMELYNNQDKIDVTNPYEIAELIYNAGYRKGDKNAVVLTREEFDRLNSCIKSEEEVRAIMQQQMLPMVRELTDKEMSKKLATVTALARKETAKEILKWLVNTGVINTAPDTTKMYFKEQYGVEVDS